VGDGNSVLARQRLARRAKEMAAIHAVMACLFVLVLVQFLLLMVAVEAFLGEKPAVLLPAALGSGLCFAASCWLVRSGIPARTGGA